MTRTGQMCVHIIAAIVIFPSAILNAQSDGTTVDSEENVTYDLFIENEQFEELRQCGDLLFTSAPGRFVYRLWDTDPRRQDKPDVGKPIAGLNRAPSLALGFDGNAYWIAMFHRSTRIGWLHSWRATYVFVFDTEDAMQRPMPDVLSDAFGGLFPTCEEFFYSRAVLHNLKYQLDAEDFSNEAFDNAVAAHPLSRTIRSRHARSSAAVVFPDSFFQADAKVISYGGQEAASLANGGTWEYVFRLVDDSNYAIDELICSQSRRLYVYGSRDTVVDAYPLSKRNRIVRRVKKRESHDLEVDYRYYSDRNSEASILTKEGSRRVFLD